MRALAVRWVDASDAAPTADPPGEVIRYAPDRLITECVRTGLPVMVPQAKDEDLLRIARSPEAAEILARAGVHSYLAVPLIARGEVLGAIDLIRTRNPGPSTRTTCCSPGSWPRGRPCRSTTRAGTRTPATPRSRSSAACCPAIRP